jgi:hexosaminidase
LKDDAALQAYFTANVQKIVTKHKKIMEGWDEVLQPETPKDVVIQSWRGQDSLAEAARNGHQGLLSAGYYIDLNQPAREHYSIDPMAKGAANLSSEEKKRILGGEAAMWSEFVSPENIDSRIWPRAAAIAERLWSPQQVHDIDSMYDRLEAVSQHLDNYGLKHRSSYGSMLRRMTGDPAPVALRVLGDVVEPPKQYVRGELRSYDSFTPLNHLVDAVPPESNTARQFHDIVERIVAKKATAQDLQQAQQWLMLWRDNDARLQPALAKSELTKELILMSSSLHQVAVAGLQALEYMRTSQPSPAEWRNEQLALLAAAQKPEAVLLNMVAPSVAELVQATTPQQ